MRTSTAAFVSLVALALLASANPASAQAFSVTATATVALDTSQGGGISVAQPFSFYSSFQSGVHSLPATALGGPTTGFGAVSAAVHRLPYFHELRLGAASLRPGQVSVEGATSGLEIDLESLILAGSEPMVPGVTPDAQESLRFGSVELGGATTPQSGEFHTEYARLANAELIAGTWSVTSSTLTSAGIGTVVLEAPVSLSSDQQSSASVSGQATLAVSFVPEPGTLAGLLSGCGMLVCLSRRRGSRSHRSASSPC